MPEADRLEFLELLEQKLSITDEFQMLEAIREYRRGTCVTGNKASESDKPKFKESNQTNDTLMPIIKEIQKMPNKSPNSPRRLIEPFPLLEKKMEEFYAKLQASGFTVTKGPTIYPTGKLEVSFIPKKHDSDES